MWQFEFGLGAVACHLVFLIGSFIVLHMSQIGFTVMPFFLDSALNNEKKILRGEKKAF